ncbi:MAG: FAD-dependent oxidoreductase, partial [Pseudomonadota bacterium]
MRTAHIVGAGVAGLSAAERLIAGGWIARGGAMTLYDQAPRAGGRCRSWVDKALGCEIDNGNHLLLACNPTTLGVIKAHGPADALAGPDDARFDFADLRDGAVWSLRPNRGPVPWWIFAPGRRTAGAGAIAHLGGAKLLFARRGAVAADCFDTDGPLYERLWRPLCEAVMNA